MDIWAVYFIGAYLTTCAGLAVTIKYPAEGIYKAGFAKTSALTIFSVCVLLFCAWPVAAVIIAWHVLYGIFARPVG